MGGDEEQKSIELVVKDEVDKVVEKVVETTGVDANIVNPIIKEASNVVTTVIASGVQSLGLTAISESSLTEDQKKLANLIYESTKGLIKDFISDSSLNNTVKITKTLGQLIKQLEGAKVDGKSPSGGDKKAVAIQVGRILIKEVTPDDKGEAEILKVYDLVAEPTLEAMIDVSRAVNVAVQEVATKCCPGLLELFKRSKSSK